MKEIKKTVKSVSGKEIEFSGKLVTQKSGNLDGYAYASKCCDIHMDCTFNGRSQGSWLQNLSSRDLGNLPSGLGLTHKIGNVALTEENAAVWESIRTELEESPEWQEKLRKIAESDKMDQRIYEQKKRMDLINGEGF